MNKNFPAKVITGLLSSASPDAKVTSLKIDPDVERARMEVWLNERIAASAKEPVTEVVTLTPVLAQLLLQRNTANRPISEMNLDRFKRDIAAAHWEFNGQPIVISKEGLLNDGQHRIRAVMETGKSIRVVMVFGPPRNSRFTLDQGTPRTIGHYLSMKGFADANALGSAAVLAWQYLERRMLSSSGKLRPTKTETLLVVEHYGDLWESLVFVSRNGVGAICPRSLLAFTHWAIAKVGSTRIANEFFNKLISGAGLTEGSPILYCRNRLIQMKAGVRTNDKAELIFRAWNAWRNKETVERIFVLGKKLPGLER